MIQQQMRHQDQAYHWTQFCVDDFSTFTVISISRPESNVDDQRWMACTLRADITPYGPRHNAKLHAQPISKQDKAVEKLEI
eukprot:scaffold15382_cov20-Prasinocladus_malaysianus.AAC.1